MIIRGRRVGRGTSYAGQSSAEVVANPTGQGSSDDQAEWVGCIAGEGGEILQTCLAYGLSCRLAMELYIRPDVFAARRTAPRSRNDSHTWRGCGWIKRGRICTRMRMAFHNGVTRGEGCTARLLLIDDLIFRGREVSKSKPGSHMGFRHCFRCHEKYSWLSVNRFGQARVMD